MPMTITFRAACVLGLAVLGVVALVGQTSAQQKPPAEKPAPATIACVDLTAVIKGYNKYKDRSEQLKAEAMARQKQLADLMNKGQQIGREMQSLAPGSAEYKLKDDELTALQASLTAERDKAQREFAQKDADAMATVYKEVQMWVEHVARHMGYSLVVQISNEPINATNPDSVMGALARSVVYHDTKTDISDIVLYNLNKQYDEAKGTRPAAAPANNATSTGAGAAAAPPAKTARSGNAAASTKR
jgi:Skp family chaperone for outer membrane proteins